MMSMESISSQQPNNGIHRDDDYRKRILQSTCAFCGVFLLSSICQQWQIKSKKWRKKSMTHV